LNKKAGDVNRQLYKYQPIVIADETGISCGVTLQLNRFIE